MERTGRPWKKINRDAFSRDLRSSALCVSPDELRLMTAAELFDVFDGTLRQLADVHAPAFTTVQRIRRLSPWFDYDCRQARRKSRLLERIWVRHSEGPPFRRSGPPKAVTNPNPNPNPI